MNLSGLHYKSLFQLAFNKLGEVRHSSIEQNIHKLNEYQRIANTMYKSKIIIKRTYSKLLYRYMNLNDMSKIWATVILWLYYKDTDTYIYLKHIYIYKLSLHRVLN